MECWVWSRIQTEVQIVSLYILIWKIVGSVIESLCVKMEN